MIPCPLHQLTGLDCPFCGAQRGIWALLHGDIAAWWHYNPVLWCLMPYFLLMLFAEIYTPARSWKWVAFFRTKRVLLVVAITLIIWGIYRNISY